MSISCNCTGKINILNDTNFNFVENSPIKGINFKKYSSCMPLFLWIMAEHNETGKTGEALASHYLQEKGYVVLHVNFKHGRHEIDIIASFEDVLHFIEVKTKAGKGLGQPEQRVNAAKIGRMKRVAEHFLFLNTGWRFIQFDILSITMQEGREEEYLLIEDIY